MDRRFRRAAGLAALLFLSLPAVVPPASGHPFHIMIDNSVIGSPESVDSARWVGQSFVPASSFVVTRVTLFVEDTGTSDVLAVSIRDVGGLGFPGPTTLASGSADGPGAPGWLDIDLSPNPMLAAGQAYWIVASSAISSGYDWWNSNDDLAYGPGTAATSGDGFTWSGAGKDYSFRVYGYSQPSLSYSASASTTTVGPGQSVTFRANFTNVGPGTSAALWVNVTLPPELSYTGDDAASIGGVRSGTYDFAFTDVAPGSYSFNVTAVAAGGVADGTVVSTLIAFEGTDHNGAPLSGAGYSLPVTMRNARLSLTLAASASDADPGDRLVLNATVTNLGAEPAAAVVVEGTVDANATYATSVPIGTYNAGARTVTWNLGALAPAAAQSFAWTVDIPIGTPDLATATSRARVTYEDAAAIPLPDETALRTATVHRPGFAPALRLDRTAAEAAMEVVASVDYNNTGSGNALAAWLNWSFGGHYRLVALSPPLAFAPTPGGFSIPLANVASGPHTVSARLAVLRGLQDRLSMGLQVSLEATDGNGNSIPSIPLAAAVDLLAPSLSVSLATSDGTVPVASLFVLEVVIENTGRATANGWLNLSLPSAANYVADNGTFAVTELPGRVSWRILSMAAGARVHLGVTLRGVAPATTSFRFLLNFTDGAGSPAASVLSNAIAVEFIGSGLPRGDPGTSWLWWLAILVIALVPPIVLLARSRGRLDEVFLVGYSGILLAHLSNTIKSERDRDLVTGMLTAVQDFIRESFQGTKEGEELRRMDFGARTIIIRRGGHSYLAAIVRGRAPFGLNRKMVETLRKLEAKYTDSLLNGTVDGRLLDGAGELLSQELLGH